MMRTLWEHYDGARKLIVTEPVLIRCGCAQSQHIGIIYDADCILMAMMILWLFYAEILMPCCLLGSYASLSPCAPYAVIKLNLRPLCLLRPLRPLHHLRPISSAQINLRPICPATHLSCAAPPLCVNPVPLLCIIAVNSKTLKWQRRRGRKNGAQGCAVYQNPM